MTDIDRDADTVLAFWCTVCTFPSSPFKQNTCLHQAINQSIKFDQSDSTNQIQSIKSKQSNSINQKQAIKFNQSKASNRLKTLILPAPEGYAHLGLWLEHWHVGRRPSCECRLDQGCTMGEDLSALVHSKVGKLTRETCKNHYTSWKWINHYPLSGRLTWMAGISPCLIGNTSSILVHFQLLC